MSYVLSKMIITKCTHNSIIMAFLTITTMSERITLKPCMLHPVSIGSFRDCGGIVPIGKTTSVPSIRFRKAIRETKYTLVMIDPDSPVPSCNQFAFLKHWMVSNVSACFLLQGTTNLELTSEAIVHQKYIAPSPDTGIHRYQFILFEELFGRIVADTQPGVRAPFELNGFVNRNHLRAVGSFEYRIDSGKPENCSVFLIDDIQRRLNIILPPTIPPELYELDLNDYPFVDINNYPDYNPFDKGPFP